MIPSNYIYSGANPSYRSLYREDAQKERLKGPKTFTATRRVELRSPAVASVVAMVLGSALVVMNPALMPGRASTGDAAESGIGLRAGTLRRELEQALAAAGLAATVFATEGEEGDHFVEAVAEGRRLSVRLHPGSASSWAVVTAHGGAEYGALATLDVAGMVRTFAG